MRAPALGSTTKPENYYDCRTLLLIVILLLIGALPTWPYSKSRGYWPGGLLGTVVIILLILLLLGRL